MRASEDRYTPFEHITGSVKQNIFQMISRGSEHPLHDRYKTVTVCIIAKNKEINDYLILNLKKIVENCIFAKDADCNGFVTVM